jgi:F-box-like
MSISKISQSNELVADVLHVIFQHLEGEDLVNCEAVCRQWRDILLAGTPWRRLFHRNKEKLPLWRKTQKKLVSNKLTLRTEQYRDVCRKILLVHQNWRMGHFTKLTCPSAPNSAFNLTMNDDYVAWGFVRIENDECFRGCAFLDTDSMEITEIPLLSGYKV